MATTMNFLATIGLIGVWGVTLRARSSVRQTSLVTAWCWGLVAITWWSLVWLITLATNVTPGIADQLWYAVAVLAPTPLLAVLGARRPRVNTWNFFVLIPFVVIFGFSALHAWSGDGHVSELQVEPPVVFGYLFVIVMGAGNYFGTRFTGAALLTGLALLLLFAPFSSAVPASFPDKASARAWATLLLSLGMLWGYAKSRVRQRPPGRYDLLWIDFRDRFGIVWSKRVLDRWNAAAETGKWNVRLDLHGVTSLSDQSANELAIQSCEAIESTFRRLLTRFVDVEWITVRIQNDAALPESENAQTGQNPAKPN